MSSKKSFSEAELAAAAWSRLQREQNDSVQYVKYSDKSKRTYDDRSRSRSREKGYYGSGDKKLKKFVRSSDYVEHRNRRSRSKSRSRSRSNSRQVTSNYKSAIYQDYVKPVDSIVPLPIDLMRKDNVGKLLLAVQVAVNMSIILYMVTIGRDPVIRGRTPPRRSPSPDARRYRSNSRDNDRRLAATLRSWSHDLYSVEDELEDPGPPRRAVPSDYRPPSPTWVSRAGGVANMKRKKQQ